MRGWLQAEQWQFEEQTLLSTEEEKALLKESEPPARRRAGRRGALLLHQCPTSRPGGPGQRVVTLRRCRRGRGKQPSS